MAPGSSTTVRLAQVTKPGATRKVSLNAFGFFKKSISVADQPAPVDMGLIKSCRGGGR